MALKNVGASVRARLLRLAQQRHDSFEDLLVRYVHERLLYRLGSEQRARFALKGALLFRLWGSVIPRATRDLDLMWHGESSPEAIAAVFRSLCLLDEPDGVMFDADSVAAEPIREHQEYLGVRVVLRADVAGARVRVQVDLGFGDAIDPPAQRVTYPSLLDAPAPVVMAYPREVVVAEKFQAMVDLGMDNSRMKDYFDLDVLSRRHGFHGADLARALEATFRRRRTPLPSSTPPGLSDAFGEDAPKRAQWSAFQKRLRVQASGGATPSLLDVVVRIRGFVMPVAEALALGRPWSAEWQAGGPWQR